MEPGYFQDMKIVDQRLTKLEFQVSKLAEVLEKIKKLLENRNS